MNILDKVIGYFSPSTGAARLRSRYAMQLFDGQVRKFEGASGGRRNKNWNAGAGSANSDIQAAGNRLAYRSRDLGQNNPYARRAFSVIPNNTVGTGIQAQIKPAGGNSKRAGVQLKNLWKLWADSTECDLDGIKHFGAIQAMVMRAVVESGEVLVRFVRDSTGTVVPLRLQVLESDYLDSTREMPTDTGGYVLQGIEFDSKNRRVGYWLFDQHPGEVRIMQNIQSKFVPASEVLHIFVQERPGQHRGVPFLASAMNKLHDFGEYEDAQLIRQKIAACFAAFVEDTVEPTPGTGVTADGLVLERVEPGIIEHLSPGQKVSFGTPPTVENYDEYSRSQLQGIAAGVGVSYEALTGNLRDVNFSSGRMGWLEFQRQIQVWQWNVLVPMLCDPVWRYFLKAASAKAGKEMTAAITWTPPRREMIDPLKETQALREQMEGNLTSWQTVVREFGEDADELFEQIQADAKRFEDAGIELFRPKNGASSGGEPGAGDGSGTGAGSAQAKK